MDAIKERLLREKIRVLLGETGAQGDHAVRRSELTTLVADIAGKVLESLLGEGEELAAAAVGEYVDDFHNGERPSGFYTWNTKSLSRPLSARGGPAIYLQRNSGVGAWLAASSDLSSERDKAKLFLKNSQGGGGNNFNPLWREMFHQGNLLGAVALLSDGSTTGAVWEVIENASGTAIRCANGYQIAYSTDLTLEQVTSATLEETWTYPATFSENPILLPMLPHGIGSFTDVDRGTIGHWEVGNQIALYSGLIRIRAVPGSAAWAATAEVRDVAAVAIGKWG